MNFCPKCGAKVTDSESKFCAVCGEALPQNLFAEGSAAFTPPAGGTGADVPPPKNFAAPPAGAQDNGVTGSFSSPFVKDALPTPKEEPLFSAVFAGDTQEPPPESSPVPSSLFEGGAPTPTQFSAAGAGGQTTEVSAGFSAAPGGHALSQSMNESPVSATEAPVFGAAPGVEADLFTAVPTAQASTAQGIPPAGEPDFFAGPPAAAPLANEGFFMPPAKEPGPDLFAEAAAPFSPGPSHAGQPDFFAGAAASAPPSGEDFFSAPAGGPQPSLFEEAPLAPAEAALDASLFQGSPTQSDEPPPPAQDFFPAQQQAPPKAAPAPKQNYPHQNPKPEPAAQRMPKPAAKPQQVYSPAAAQQPQGGSVQSIPQQSLPRQSLHTGEGALPGGAPAAGAPVQRMPSAAPGGSLLAGDTPAPARRSPPPPPPQRRGGARTAPAHSGGAGRMVRNILVAVLAALILLFGAILGFLYWQNRPSKTIDAFTLALSQRDYETLSTTVSVVGVTASGSEGWIALCDAFQDEAARAALSKEMSRVSANSNTAGFSYPSVRLEGKPLFLFIQQYHVRLSGVSVLAPGAAEGSTLRLAAGDEFNDPAGAPSAEGMLYEGIMPGQYTATLTGADGSVAEYALSAFATASPNALEAAAGGGAEEPASNFANLTIENCISDDAQIFLNGQETPAKPTGGVVQLQQVELGSTISIKAETDGNVQEASVTFSDPNVTTLSFGEYTGTPVSKPAEETGAELSADAANNVLTTFYKSYLEAINAQSLDGIQLSTAANNQNIQGRITSAANKANTYTFVSASVDPNSIQVKTEGGVTTAEMTGTCEFSYVAKENPGAPETGSNKQAIRMIYQDGQWLVDKFTTA